MQSKEWKFSENRNDQAPARLPDDNEPWDAAAVAAWLSEAMDTMSRLSVPNTRPRADTGRSAWPEIMSDVMDYAPDQRARPGAPTSDAIDRMDLAFGWMSLIEDATTRRCVLLYSGRYSLRAVGRKLGMHHDQVSANYRRGLADITTKLNRTRSP